MTIPGTSMFHTIVKHIPLPSTRAPAMPSTTDPVSYTHLSIQRIMVSWQWTGLKPLLPENMPAF